MHDSDPVSAEILHTRQHNLSRLRPGRLDVMGGIGDYSGSLVLQMPIQERTHVWLALRDDHILRAHSHQAQQPGLQDTVEFDLNRLPAHGALEYSSFHQALTENPAHSWAAYIFGCLLCLMLEKKIPPTGVDFWVESDIPFGKGVSSSAALEVAAMTALCAALELELSDNELPILAQKVENLIVGAPCGLMDQLATYHGKQNRSPHSLPSRSHFPTIEIPEPLHFIGVDSGVRHSVGGSSIPACVPPPSWATLSSPPGWAYPEKPSPGKTDS